MHVVLYVEVRMMSPKTDDKNRLQDADTNVETQKNQVFHEIGRKAIQLD